jgi:hypothetical protein
MLPHSTPGLKLREAIEYSLEYMPYVRNALSCGAAELTNNRAFCPASDYPQLCA